MAQLSKAQKRELVRLKRVDDTDGEGVTIYRWSRLARTYEALKKRGMCRFVKPSGRNLDFYTYRITLQGRDEVAKWTP